MGRRKMDSDRHRIKLETGPSIRPVKAAIIISVTKSMVNANVSV